MPLLKLHHISFRVMAVAGFIEWVKMTPNCQSPMTGIERPSFRWLRECSIIDGARCWPFAIGRSKH